VEKRTARRIADQWREAAAAGLPGALHVYLHLPFCPSLCLYCDIYRERLRAASEVEEYLKGLRAKIRFFGKAAGTAPLRSMALGGGTPSLLSAPQLNGLMKAFHEAFTLERGAVLTYECSPRTATPAKLKLARSLGFTRVSMGVQTLKASLLRDVRRGYQDSKMVRAAVGSIRAAGFPDGFNLDILAGLHGQSEADVLASFDAASKLRPDQLQINLLRPTGEYLRLRVPGRARSFHDGLQKLFADLARSVPKAALRLGYRFRPLLGVRVPLATDSDWCFSREDSPAGEPVPHYYGRADSDDPRLPLSPHSVLALGPSTRSRIAGRLFYWEDSRIERSFRAAAAGYRAHAGSRGFRKAWAGMLRGGVGALAQAAGKERCLCSLGSPAGPRALDLDPSRVCDFEIRMLDGKRADTLRLERVREGQRYLAAAGGLGLQISAGGGGALGGDRLNEVAALFGSVGRRVGHRCPSQGLSAFYRVLLLWARKKAPGLRVSGMDVRSRIDARNRKYTL